MYFFILGNNPTLSMAEIQSLIVQILSPMTTKIIEFSDEVLILETKEKIDAENLQKQLGGTIKIGQILTQTNADLRQIKADIFLKELLEKLKTLKKVSFGFSVYQLDISANAKKLMPQINKLAMEIKTKLKNQGIASRWVISKKRTLSSVIVNKNKLLNQGAEFCFFLKRKSTQIDTQINADIDVNQRSNQRELVYLGKTLSCQEFEEYEFYDFARPARKIEEGMLPPKLAKIMINLAQMPKKATILDPFCGSGTILQEAIRLGYQHIIGADVSKKAVDNTKTNLKWLAENLQTNFNVQIFQTDVRKISKKIPENSVDAIVTEPYLGPLQISDLRFKIKDLILELSNLYLAAFLEFKKILKVNGKIVIIFPIFQINKSRIFLPILDDLKKEWRIISLIPENLKKHPVIKLTPRNSIIYSRPKQKVLREIFIIEQVSRVKNL